MRNPNTLQVTATISEPTTFLGLIGISTLTAEGVGTADLVLDTSKLSPIEETNLILRHLVKEGYLPKGAAE